MTLAAQRALVGHDPITIVEIDIDKCAEVFGTAPCQAGEVDTGTAQAGAGSAITLATTASAVDDAYNTMLVYIISGTGVGQERTISDYTGATRVADVSVAWSTNPDATSVYRVKNQNISNACYNTRNTCQDITNYNRGTVTHRFCEGRANLPAGVDMQACIIGTPTVSPTKITPGKGLGARASANIKFQDFTHHDRGVDPYVANRTYTPADQGTFWGKFIARNPYYQNRIVRVRSGFITDPWDWANFEDREYVIDKLDGPDRKGQVHLVAKDILKLADDKKAVAPAASSGALTIALDAVETTSLSVTTGTGTEYTAGGGFVRIGDEIIQFASRSGDVLSTLTRDARGTTASTHSVDDSVQLCLTFDSIEVIDIVDTLLSDYTTIPAAYITPATWHTNNDLWLQSFALTATISEPTGVNKLISELTQQCLFNLWVDERNQVIELAAIAPYTDDTELTDDANFVGGSVKVVVKPDDRVSQIWVHYGQTDPTSDKYPQTYIQADLSAEGADQFGESRIVEVESRWFQSQGNAAQFAGRFLAMRRNNPRTVTFELGAKDADLWTGDPIDVFTDQMQDVEGARKKVEMLIVEVQEKTGAKFMYSAESSSFIGLYAYIAPDITPDYSSASDTEKETYGFIAPDGDGFANGDPAYKII